jgi:hypothetical protein
MIRVHDSGVEGKQGASRYRVQLSGLSRGFETDLRGECLWNTREGEFVTQGISAIFCAVRFIFSCVV